MAGGASGSAGTSSSSGGGPQGGTISAGGRSSATGGSTQTGSGGGAVTPPPTGPYTWGSVALGGGGFVSAVIASLAEKNLFYARTDVGGFYRWNEATGSWIPLLDFISEAQVGFWGVEAVALDPNAAGRVYALVGTSYYNGGKTAVLRSTDYGNTFAITDVTAQFKAHGNGMGRQNGERLAVDPNLGNVLFCGTRRNGLFKSVDSGATWTNVAAFPVTTTANDNGVAFVVFDPASGKAGSATPRLFAGVSRLDGTNLYVSNDAGASWNAVPGAPPTTQMPQRAVVTSAGTLLVTYANGAGPHGNSSGSEPMNTGSIWKYAIGSSTWSNITPAGTAQPFSGISAASSDANHLVATSINGYVQQPWGYGDRIYVSTNGGTSWTDPIGAGKVTMDTNGMPWIENHAIHWAGTATFDPFNADRVFVTSGNGIFATSNLSAATQTWKFVAKGLEETVPLEAVSIPGHGFATVIGDYDGFVSTDLFVSPPSGTHKPGVGTTAGLALAGATPSVMIRIGAKMYRTANSGATWTEITRANTQTGGTLALSADGAVILWTPDSSTTTYRTQNNGAQWTNAAGLNANVAVAADAINPNKFYAYNPMGGAFYVSTNGGASFTQTTTAGGGGSKKLRAVPGSEGDIWLPLYNGGLTRSTNSGTSFTKLSNVSRCDAVGFGKAAAGKTFPTVFIYGVAGAGVVGIYRSIDAGASWERVNDDQHQFGGPANGQFVVGDMNVFGRVYMSSSGRGVIFGQPR